MEGDLAGNGESWESVYCSEESKCLEYDFVLPYLPRKRFIPKCIHEGDIAHTYETPRDYYRQVYYSRLDTIVGTVNERFDQSENLLIFLEKFLVCLKFYRSTEESSS